MPAFVSRWLKDTSATGYLRGAENPNQRKQDMLQLDLLCQDCESVFSLYEREFSNKIFYPYVKDGLSIEGIQTKRMNFAYDDWLLRFIISIYWRHAVTSTETALSILDEWQEKLMKETIQTWGQFLRDERSDIGRGETHMIFLQSLSDIKSASSEVLNRLPSNVNMYLLRTVDATIFRSRKKLGCFAKVGPIAFFTVLEPHRLKNAQETRIRMRGSACSVQNIRNTDISEFIFVTRPREIDEYLTLSDEQKAKIHKTMLKNPERVLNSMTIHAQEETLR